MSGEAHVHRHPHGTEGLFGFVADDHSHQVVGAGARLRADDDSHAEGQDHAAQPPAAASRTARGSPPWIMGASSTVKTSMMGPPRAMHSTVPMRT